LNKISLFQKNAPGVLVHYKNLIFNATTVCEGPELFYSTLNVMPCVATVDGKLRRIECNRFQTAITCRARYRTIRYAAVDYKEGGAEGTF
jgi:hypothetical protein